MPKMKCYVENVPMPLVYRVREHPTKPWEVGATLCETCATTMRDSEGAILAGGVPMADPKDPLERVQCEECSRSLGSGRWVIIKALP